MAVSGERIAALAGQGGRHHPEHPAAESDRALADGPVAVTGVPFGGAALHGDRQLLRLEIDWLVKGLSVAPTAPLQRRCGRGAPAASRR
jgi:hypothetical protein